MIELSKTPRCAKYLKALRVNPDEDGMNEYWAALCIAESYSEQALKKFGGINFHTMKGPALLSRMEEFLESRSKALPQSSKKLKVRQPRWPTITNAEIEAAKTARGGWTAAQLAAWGVPWPPPGGWRYDIVNNGLPYRAGRK